MRVFKPGVDGEQVEAAMLEQDERLKSCHINHRTGAGWPATFAMEVVKLHCAYSSWPVQDEFSQSGEQVFTVMSPTDLVARAFEIVDTTLAELGRRGWTVQLPSLGEMLETSGGKTGFVVHGSDGKAGQSSAPLSGQDGPA